MRKITDQDYQQISNEFGIPVASIKAVCSVEGSGKGYDELTQKILIQFEPSWFKRKAPFTPSGKWSVNGVERQSNEWSAFNDAFQKNANGAMESTSIGMMQVMGFHWKLLGFHSVGEMWDYAKESEANQVRLGMRFIKSNSKMFGALVNKDWKVFAYYYNGEQYRKFNYDVRLNNAYLKFA